MSYHEYKSSHSGFGTGHITKTVKALVVINIGVFLLVSLFGKVNWFMIFGLVPHAVLSKFMIWQFATYMFLHVGLWHLVMNMLMLWFFGPAIEGALGRKKFIFYYFFTGIGAGLCSFLLSFNSSIPVIGASGAIFGLLVMYAFMFPDDVILLFFIFPMKMKHAVLVLAGINLLGAISSTGGGIAYFAHLGGALFGYLYLKNEWIRRVASDLSLDSFKRSWPQSKNKSTQNYKQYSLDQKVDMILDKISRHGMRSLTKEEKNILKQKSRTNP